MALTIDRELTILLEHPDADRRELARLLNDAKLGEERRALLAVWLSAVAAVLLCIPVTTNLASTSSVAAVLFALWGGPLIALTAALLGERLAAASR